MREQAAEFVLKTAVDVGGTRAGDFASSTLSWQYGIDPQEPETGWTHLEIVDEDRGDVEGDEVAAW